MFKVHITRKSELTEGGCNACGIVDATVYLLELGTKKATISELTVGSLVDSLALLEGYGAEDIYEMLDEVRQLKKADRCINVHYEHGDVQFQMGNERVKVKNSLERPALYEQVNQILEQFFDLGPYVFIETKESIHLNPEWQKLMEDQTENTYLFQ
ncbi:DUF4809 family protein [Enterococcus villorum]|uniref:DUF4809 domain-containing protein n=2 Tax=Enterococcus villorum TaxID=112904 RepID=A0A511J1V4_9ENTE|nr:DUF4809 family protein [Enterococcus villorum]EOH92664.1 hypothetical protein UAO_00355 [Enterococcus villorum ATCC 700913]EOW75572.1 hypothetical protein I591_02665 [Enterococcus villorum ATCC 700913]GEL91996.1 DUF4809 domain-containing protein [Enterococcus villorum]